MLKYSQSVFPAVCLKFQGRFIVSEITDRNLPVGYMDVACCGDGASGSGEA